MAIAKRNNGTEEIQEIELIYIYKNLIFDKGSISNYCPTMLEQLAMLGKWSLITIPHILQRWIKYIIINKQ